MEQGIRVNLVQSENDLKQVFDIRKIVFVEEQKVDEREEYDDYENSSKHLMALLNQEVVGAARVRKTAAGVKLERFAVLKQARGKGVGAALVEEALKLTEGIRPVYLHAQIQVVDFYAKYGFIAVGDEFEEAGIRHFKMVLGA